MKVFYTTVLAFVCMGVLLWGNIHWNNKTAVSGEVVKTPKSAQPAKVEQPTTPPVDLMSYAENWPAGAIEGFKNAMESNRTYKILIVGSTALGDEENGWAAETEKQLLQTFGEENMEVEIMAFEQNSTDFINNGGANEIAESNADLILFEPFTLMDNGVVAIENSQENIQTVMDETLENRSETVFILMPPHPIYNATYYPRQVDALKVFAEQNNITYLDHWKAWPEYTDRAINDYLTANQDQPNEEGHKLWANYMIEYLISN